MGQGITIETEGSVELVCHTPTDTIPYIFYLRNNSHLHVGPIRLRDTGYDPAVIWRGAGGFAMIGGPGDNWGNVTFEGIYANRLVYPVVLTGGDVGVPNASNRIRGVHIEQLYCDDCFYGFSAQNQGDGIVIDNMVTHQNVRPYFAYGVVGHKVGMLFNRNNRVTSGMVNIARIEGGLSTTDIEINYVARDMVAVGSTPHVLINHIGLTGAEISNIRLDIDINDPHHNIPQFPLRFVNYTTSFPAGVETAAPSPNIVKDIRITASARPIDAAPIAVASYAFKGLLEFRHGRHMILDQSIYDAFTLHPQGQGVAGLTWSATTAQPELGNGALTYDVRVAAGMAIINMTLTFGSTTVGGIGGWTFSGFGLSSKIHALGQCLAIDSAGGNFWTGIARVDPGTNNLICLPHNAPTQFGVSRPLWLGHGGYLAYHHCISAQLGRVLVCAQQRWGSYSSSSWVPLLLWPPGSACAACKTVMIMGGSGTGDIEAVGSSTTGEAGTVGTPLTALWFGAAAAPSAPGAGQGRVYLDNSAKNLCVVSDDSAVKCGVEAQPPIANQFVTSIVDGNVTTSRPTLANLTDGATVVKVTTPQIVEDKQLVPRVCLFAATSGNLTPNLDLCDISWRHDITGTINIQTPTATGTNPRAMHALTLSLRAASPQTITWSAAYAGNYGLPLPTSLPAGVYMGLIFRWNVTSLRYELWAGHIPAPIRQGQITIANAATTATVTLTPAELDTGYFVQVTPVTTSGAPAAGSFTVNGVSKAIGTFQVSVLAAPGAGTSVIYDWLIHR